MQITESVPQKSALKSMGRIAGKALLLFLLVNLVFALWYPVQGLGRLSAYNGLLPGRQRLPYGDHPQKSFNLSLFNLEAMFASHELAGGTKPEDEFRVLLIGDSSAWGFLLLVEDTLSARINAFGNTVPDGRTVRVYNLGYPVMSLTKDLLLLSYGLQYDPDMIVWPVTLESMPVDKQLFPAILTHNPQNVRDLVSRYGLDVDVQSVEWVEPTLWERTIAGGRRGLADWLRLQLYGVLWAATGIDQDIPENYTPRQEDLADDKSFHDLKPDLLESDLAFDVLNAGIKMAGDVPLLIINEPMFISRGENSDIRYNFYYPRWAYDGYRVLMDRLSESNNWNYIDLWDVIPPPEFTNSAVHLSPGGSDLFARLVLDSILELVGELENDWH